MFKTVVQEYVEEIRSGVVRWGGRYIDVPTDKPMDLVLRRALLAGSGVGWA